MTRKTAHESLRFNPTAQGDDKTNDVVDCGLKSLINPSTSHERKVQIDSAHKEPDEPDRKTNSYEANYPAGLENEASQALAPHDLFYYFGTYCFGVLFLILHEDPFSSSSHLPTIERFRSGANDDARLLYSLRIG